MGKVGHIEDTLMDGMNLYRFRQDVLCIITTSILESSPLDIERLALSMGKVRALVIKYPGSEIVSFVYEGLRDYAKRNLPRDVFTEFMSKAGYPV